MDLPRHVYVILDIPDSLPECGLPDEAQAAPRLLGVDVAARRELNDMASYTVNRRAVEHARELIERRQYVVRSEWGDVQPRAAEQDVYLASHTWDDYAAWHLGLTEGASEDTKGRYAFVFGDFRRLHRTGLIACHYRAAEWEHKEIELAAHELLQVLDTKRA